MQVGGSAPRLISCSALEEAYGVRDHGNGVKSSLSAGIGNTDAEADAATYQRKAIQKAAQGIANRTEDQAVAAAPEPNSEPKPEPSEQHATGRTEGVEQPSLGAPTPRRTLTGNELGGADVPTPDLRERIRQYIYRELRVKSYTNTHIETPIKANRTGIDETLRHAGNTPSGRAHAQSLVALDQMLEDATHVQTDSNTDPTQTALKAVHRFVTPINIAGQPFHAHLVIKESPEGHFFYDHRLTQIEPDAATGDIARPVQGRDTQATEPGSTEPDNTPDAPVHQWQDGGDAGSASGSTPETLTSPSAESSTPSATGPSSEPPSALYEVGPPAPRHIWHLPGGGTQDRRRRSWDSLWNKGASSGTTRRSP